MDKIEILTVNGVPYRVLSLLGRGKGGYSYLVEGVEQSCGEKFVLKQIHHEPCDYYQFADDKLGTELRDYETLCSVGLRMPKLIAFDRENERILKQFIDGETVASLVERGEDVEEYVSQMRQACTLLYARGLNVDYYPTNFVASGGVIYYVDYECNAYMSEWDFENWGIKYWRKNGQA